MPASKYVRPTVWVPSTVSAVLQPQPPLAPSIPPVHVVDLMTEAGSAAFGAVWRVKEAKLVECPALTNSLPEFKTTYHIADFGGAGKLPPCPRGEGRRFPVTGHLWLEY
jgi:hypothetical protein